MGDMWLLINMSYPQVGSQHAPGPVDHWTAQLCLFVTFLATKADEGKFFYHFDLAQAAEVGPMVQATSVAWL